MIKDAFISYGRRESLGFVGRLYIALQLRGYRIWFDKVNIPDGDDYAQRISHGIESAHNFILIMAPRCLTSPYCLVELEYARLLGKRVIPINQMVIFDAPDTPLSESDKQVLAEFYEANGMQQLPIRTQRDVLKRSHELLGKTDWVYGRQDLSEDDINQLHNWQLSYENKWRQHQDPAFSQEEALPIFGKDIDDFEDIVESIEKVINHQENYVHQHTQLLTEALFWDRNRRQTNFLLVGKERQEAQKWLTKVFVAPEQPPCTPSLLHGEFITASKQNADNLMTEIFLSYTPETTSFAKETKNYLTKTGITVCVPNDKRQIGFAQDIQVEQQIIQSDNFLILLSKSFLEDNKKLEELRMAVRYHKRIIVLLAEKVQKNDIPEALKNLRFIDLTDNRTESDFTYQLDLELDFKELLNIIAIDYDYYRNHKRYLAQAIKWKEQHQNDAILLRGHNLDKAQTWLEQGKRKAHLPTDIHTAFVEESTAKVGMLGSEVFISYSRTDGDFARWINEELQLNGRTTWFDQECIPAGSDFGEEIKNGIETSDNFLFILSPASISSPYCETEVRYALDMGKRFITIKLIEANKIPDYFPEHIQWVDFENAPNPNEQFRELLRALNADREHVQKHSRYQQKALDWQQSDKDESLVLRGSELLLAQVWAKDTQIEQRTPSLTALQKDFLKESTNTETTEAQKQQRTILRLRTFLVLAVLALVVASGLGLWVHSLNMNMNRRAKELKIAYDSLDTKNKQEQFLKYINYLQDGDHQFALAEYENAIKAYSIAVEFADSLQQLTVEDKIKQCQNLSSQKDEFYTLVEAGDEALKKRDLPTARTNYEKAISISYDPALMRRKMQVLQGFIEAEIYRLRQRALYLTEINREQESLKFLTKALELTPNDTSLIVLRKKVMNEMLLSKKGN